MAFLITSTDSAVETQDTWYFAFVASTSLKSLSMVITSAIDGIPARPSLVDISPSFITPLFARFLSSGNWIINESNAFDYSKALFKTAEFSIDFVASVNPFTPALVSKPISHKFIPSKFFVREA